MLKSNKGFSLVEVLMATGIMGFLIISIMGLFAMGEKGVKESGTYTEALAAGDHIMNQLNSIARQRVYTIFGADETTTGTYSWEYDATSGAITYTGGSGFMTSVYNYLGAGDKEVIDSIKDAISSMYKSDVSISISPLTDIGNGGPANPTYADAPALKIEVLVSWVEQQRDFSMRFETIR